MSDRKNSVIYTDLADDELIRIIRSGDDKALNHLILRYAATVSMLSGKYFSSSLTDEDWFQEGMIGFLNAVRTYDCDAAASFSTYACVCIKNRLKSSLKKAQNTASTLFNDTLEYNDDFAYSAISPEDSYIENENYRCLTQSFFSKLSETEQKVIRYYISGFSYKEIAKRLKMSEKSVDNALCRAKAKLKKAFND